MKKTLYLVILIFLIFFVIFFLTNILGSINPNVSDCFNLSGTLTGMLPFSFFIAYSLISIPSGMMILILPLLYILNMSFRASPLIKNATFKSKVKTDNKNQCYEQLFR
jgi:hypothetical protein